MKYLNIIKYNIAIEDYLHLIIKDLTLITFPNIEKCIKHLISKCFFVTPAPKFKY